MTSEISPRYVELYEYYHGYFVDYQATQGQPAEADAAHAYAAEHAAAAFTAEGGTPPAADVRPHEAAAAAETPVATEVPAAVETAAAVGAPAAVETPAPVEAPVAAEQPAAEQPAFVPPVESGPYAAAPVAGAPGAPGVVTPGTAGPAFAAAPAAPKKRGKGLLIGIIAGVAAIALIVAGIFIVPGLLGGGTKADARLDDIRTEPSDVWSYEAAGNEKDYNNDVSFSALGSDRILAVSAFDYFAWWEDNQSDVYSEVDWYEGIEDDYQAGWDAGVAYNAAVDAAWEDFSLPYPDREDFYPAEFEGKSPYEATYDEEHAGAFVGWYDAYFEDEFGTSLPTKPVTPDDTSTIAVVSAADGKELWSVALTDVLTDHSPEATFEAIPTADGSKIVVFNADYDNIEDFTASTIAVLDAKNGKVLSSVEVEGVIFTADLVGDSLVAVVVEEKGGDKFEANAMPFSLAKLDAEPAWSFEVDSEDAPYVAADGTTQFSLTTFDSDMNSEVEYYSLANGKESALSDGRYLRTVQGTTIAIDESDDETVELSALSADGKEKWSIEVADFRVIDNTLFIWEDCNDSGCEDMSTVDMGNGELKWKKGYDNALPLAIVGDRILSRVAEDGEAERQLIWLSLGSGEEIDADAPKLPADIRRIDIRVAQSMLYVEDEDEIVAFSFTERKSVWSYDLDSDEQLWTIGTKLYIWNSDSNELSLLAAG